MLIEITDPIYIIKVWVSFEDTFDKMADSIPPELDRDPIISALHDTPMCGARTFLVDDFDGHTFFVWFPFSEVTRSTQYALIAHEMFHVTWMTMRDRGVTLSDDSDEAYAYYVQFLVQCIMQFILKTK